MILHLNHFKGKPDGDLKILLSLLPAFDKHLFVYFEFLVRVSFRQASHSLPELAMHSGGTLYSAVEQMIEQSCCNVAVMLPAM